jgi:transposase
VAFELGKKEWKLAMTSGFGRQPWLQTVAGGDLGAVDRAVRRGRERFGLPGTARVISCYEAGRDGFWIHRALVALGVENREVDSASIEVNRRARRTKTDRIDALKLVMMLVRVCSGEQRVWAEVRVPTAEAEAARHVSRERAAAPSSALARLVELKGIATTSASVLLDEGLVWRACHNRRQLGGLLGFAPAKYDSGDSSRDQGITRAGNQRLQSVMVQLAWGWLHWQPLSGLARWYQERFGRGKRTRKVGIVALARKLFIALWRYVTAGVLPVGAVRKAA